MSIPYYMIRKTGSIPEDDWHFYHDYDETYEGGDSIDDMDKVVKKGDIPGAT